MKQQLLIFISFTSSFCFGQNEYELLEKAEFEANHRNYVQAVEIYNKLIDISNGDNLDSYIFNRAEAKYNSRDYKGAMEDLNEVIKRNDNFCYALYLRGQIKLKFNDRDSACYDLHKANELCKTMFNLTIEIQCDKSWDYDKILKVYCHDTTYLETTIDAYYIDCKEKVVDTLYSIKEAISEKGNDWEVYYDKQLKNKLCEQYTRNDTVYKIYFYDNGQLKREDHTVDYIWVYSAEWCKNGQLISKVIVNNPEYHTETTYYCNGNRQYQGNLWHGRTWGIETRWYDNGLKKYEGIYTEFNQELALKEDFETTLLSSQFWDELGNEVKPFQYRKTKINTFGAPMPVSLKQLNGASAYYNIKGQKEYDNNMKLFKETVYKSTKLKSSCKCNFGIVYISFIVSKEGIINDVKLENSLDDCVDNMFVEAVRNINKWTSGKINGEAVDVHVKIGFEIEKLGK